MPIIIITIIGLVCGVLIFLAFVKIPQKVKGLERTEEINAILPGRNCAACGYPGCFGFAQALTKNPELIRKTTCALTVQDTARLEQLGAALGLTLDASAMAKRALVRCAGKSDSIYQYSGTETCKAATELFGGYKKCLYGCLGLGDCVKVCIQNAISIDPEKKVAVIDWDKCVGCGLCATECPRSLIEMVPTGTKIAFRCNYQPLRDIPGREKCEFGCTHCRKCFNACEVNAIIWDKTKATPEFDFDKCTLCLKCIEVCPQSVLKSTVGTVAEKAKEPVSV